MVTATKERPAILIVEDEQLIALDLRNSLAQLGYQVIDIATDGRSAVEFARAKSPDAVLMDIELGGTDDGVSAASTICRELDIPVVFVTAHADAQTLTRAKKAGAMGYLTKPIRTGELNATLTLVLHQHKLTREWFSEHGWMTTLLASLAEAVIATDVQGNVRYLNPLAEALTGWTQQEAAGKPIEQVGRMLTLDRQELEICQSRQALLLQQPTGRRQFLLVTHSQTEVPIEAVASPILNQNGEVAGAAALFWDISAQQQTERERERLMAELERSNRELAEYSYAVSHDLQVPLRTLRMFTELLQQRTEGQMAPENAQLLSAVADAAAGMQRLISSLLKYSQAGHGPVRRERVDIASLVRRIQFNLAPMISETCARIETAEVPAIEADPVQMEQLFQNLIGNAIKYRQPGVAPFIRIFGETVQDGWVFSVEDNGEGVPAEFADTIFKPLKRLHGSEKPGTGLGLALCRTIVERHGGTIWVESRQGTPGSVFRFALSAERASPDGRHERAN